MKNATSIAISVLMLLPTMGTAGTSYDLIFRDPMQPTPAPLVSRHFVQGGKVRVELPQNAVLIFNEQAMYVIDYAAKTMRVQPPRDQPVAKISDQIDRIRAKAQTAPPEQRATIRSVSENVITYETHFPSCPRAAAGQERSSTRQPRFDRSGQSQRAS